MQDRIQRQLRETGVTIVSPVNTYIEAGVDDRRRTRSIQPFTFIGRDASIGADCVIGPFACIPRDSDRAGRDAPSPATSSSTTTIGLRRTFTAG